MKYNPFLTLILLVKLTSSFHIIMLQCSIHACTYIHYNAGAGCEEVTLKNHGSMEIFVPRKYTEWQFLR